MNFDDFMLYPRKQDHFSLLEKGMSNRIFSERLNQGLDEIGVPSNQHERMDALAKLIGIPRLKAEAVLNGQAVLDEALLMSIATELEVSTDWLLGHTDEQ